MIVTVSLLRTHEDAPVSHGDEEPSRFLGMPRGKIGPYTRDDEEVQHILGLPADWYGPIDLGWLRSLRHPIKAYKHWALVRRLGPYAPDEGDLEPEG